MQWHTPIGYKVINGKIEIYEEHSRIVEQIFKDYDGGASAIQIANDLKEREIKNANDRVAWTHASIGRILENHNYLGTEDYPQLIDTELFERVQKRREKVRKEIGRGKHRPSKKERLIFSGMLVCSECGCAYRHYQPGHKKERYGVPKWKCKNYVYQNKVSCGGGFITDRQAEEVCIRAVNELIRNPRLTEKWEEKEQKVSAEYRRLERQIESAWARQKREEHPQKEITLEEGLQKAELPAAEQMAGDSVIKAEVDEMTALLFRKAAERYKTLEVRDEEIRSAEMREALAGREEIKEFDEELYRKLIKQIIVYKDDSAEVVFINNNRVKIEYQNL